MDLQKFREERQKLHIKRLFPDPPETEFSELVKFLDYLGSAKLKQEIINWENMEIIIDGFRLKYDTLCWHCYGRYGVKKIFAHVDLIVAIEEKMICGRCPCPVLGLFIDKLYVPTQYSLEKLNSFWRFACTTTEEVLQSISEIKKLQDKVTNLISSMSIKEVLSIWRTSLSNNTGFSKYCYSMFLDRFDTILNSPDLIAELDFNIIMYCFSKKYGTNLLKLLSKIPSDRFTEKEKALLYNEMMRYL